MKIKKTNASGYTFEVEPIKQDELKPGSHVEVNWSRIDLNHVLYSGKYVRKLKKYHQIRMIDERWPYSTNIARVPLEVIFKITAPVGKKEGATA